ncbi:aminoglycoside phosphotransferase family protein [Microlunatus speluncae]|uniref:aminoglycoside phosphotransferase family protein n=1 Tax=Microlunatus speluncae TaxID=2594267 RepID=UPI0012662020|nr:aminoglycoside phosphotransferase family protein [Microlunatus speluncae]
MRMPEAEIDLSADLVRTLITDQHPDLAGPLTLIANGWDNVIFRLGDDLLVRLPRRAVAARLVINEQRWLPVIADQLPAPIPTPVRIGAATADYPWPWTICRWHTGMPLIDVPVEQRTVLAVPLAEFLAALHQPAPAEAVTGPDRPENPVRGIPLAGRSELAEDHLGSGAIPDPERFRTLWAELVATPTWSHDPVWVHGDPHPANLLADHDQLAAVIDFGDITVGDPATDLAAVWLAFNAAGRRTFRDRYMELTGPDPDTWQRGRGWGLSIGMSLLANSDDNPQLAAVGHHALSQVVLDMQ